MTKDEELRLALEYVELVPDDRYNADHIDRDALITAIKAALEAKDEPVAWMNAHDVGFKKSEFGNTPTIPLYTTPPQRTWVGLTDDEMDAIYEQHHNQYGECESANLGYERAIEAKLKEKNI